MQVISSKDNDLIKHIRKLKDKKYRDEYDEFIVEGLKMVEEALEEKVKFKTIIICEEFLGDSIKQDLLYDLAKENVVYVTAKVFKLLTDVLTPQGILAVVEKNKSNELNYKEDLFLILDNIQDPGNMGTIIRTADSVGLSQIIVQKNSVDCYNQKVVRSSMGAIYRVNIIESQDLGKTIKELKKHKIKIYATDLKTDKSIYDVDYKKSAIIIGNEANGVSQEVLKLADERIKIPMKGKTESLNAAVATGIILYNAVR